ncbi:hypothetical protein [Streptomyces sp. NPDC088762]|uniref:hypothetical protein n=1 Tax=Streptomyces sp. NPDC088762 TaxID=3365891 RepID=UPI0038236DB9
MTTTATTAAAPASRLIVLDMAGTTVADGGLIAPVPGARATIEELRADGRTDMVLAAFLRTGAVPDVCGLVVAGDTAYDMLSGRRAGAGIVADVLHAGHTSGAASQEYLNAIGRVDTLIGQPLTAVHNRPAYARENWTILVTTDHGHTDAGGHGGSTIQERGTFVIAKGAGFPAGSVRDDVRLVDVAATALQQVGVPTTGLDGVPLNAPDDATPSTACAPASGPAWTRRASRRG